HHVVLCGAPSDALETAAALTSTARVTRLVDAVRVLAAVGELPAMELRRRARVDGDDLARLIDAGVVVEREEPVERVPLAGVPVARRPPPALLPAQRAAADAVAGAVEAARAETFLLHGVTGSGKTEVYLDALRRCVEQGRRAIVMVPEIALTPQTVRRFRERFERVTVLHSGLTDGEMFDAWHAIAAGGVDVVIGARSAVFAPQPDLGLIVLDEEHEWTYKQHDPPPRYHARDVAIQLARRKGAAVVLGSATPDLVSYHRASRGEYTLLSLPERVRPLTGAGGSVRPVTSYGMPRIEVVDLREELKAGNRGMFSAALQRTLAETLAAGEQAILFLNRRGMAGHVQCRDCGFVPECASCAVALTYHRQYDRLVCHQCNRNVRLPVTCKQCGSPRIRLLGVGVEKVEAEARRLFPHARLLRWDRDVTRTRGAHDRILAAFLAHEADVLIGTQMLAKGLDLPAVTLVGVVNADIGLNLPDYRSAERTFQLLTQVAGRAGRADRPGRVIIQTYTPDNYAIDAASRYDFDGFVQRELDARRVAAYPPFTRLVRLLYAHTNAAKARDEAMRLKRALLQRRAELGDDTQVTGPSPAYVQRLRGRWRWQLLLRGREPAALVRGFVLPPEWAVDVDPVSLL
ncbi:MAG TPA: primosomal protein N', partial [Dehalococcoidia bacterium]|nr:primosomal protein N' [Dehalococcoidia bacterium]